MLTKDERALFAERVLEALPGRQTDIARRLRRRPSDGTVHRTLRQLAAEGRVEVRDGVWDATGNLSTLPSGYQPPADLDPPARALLLARLSEWHALGVLEDADITAAERYVAAAQRAREATQ